MDQKDTKCVGICNKLFDFIMKSLALQALKKATLGNPNPNPTNPVINDQSTLHPTAHVTSGVKVESMNDTISSKRSTSSSSSSSSSLRSLLQNDRAFEESSAQPKAPKKMVSINDRVEEIHEIMKERKKSVSFDKLSSFSNTPQDEPMKRLRSILKAPSNLDR